MSGIGTSEGTPGARRLPATVDETAREVEGTGEVVLDVAADAVGEVSVDVESGRAVFPGWPAVAAPHADIRVPATARSPMPSHRNRRTLQG
jgi:hypothetical protein